MGFPAADALSPVSVAQCCVPAGAAPEAVSCMPPFMPRGVQLRSTAIALPNLLGQDAHQPFGLEEAPASDAHKRQSLFFWFLPLGLCAETAGFMFMFKQHSE